jgi:hypothetical protein
MAVTLKLIPLAQQLAIKALLETGKSERYTAKLSGVSRATVRAVRDCRKLDPDAVTRIKNGLAAKFYDVTDRALENVTDDKLRASSSVQLMTTAAIGVDKARLIEGKATSRTEYVNASDKEIDEEIVRLEGELGKWERGEILNAEGTEEENTTPAGQPASETVDQGSNGAD